MVKNNQVRLRADKIRAMEPLVSIVMPTYNGARYIRESIDSCLNQTYSNFELIIVDDFSSDGTPQILCEYRDPRMRFIRHEANRKLPAALNTGFAASNGEYLTWTSDDNRYAADAIEVLVHALEQNPGAGLVYAGVRLIDEFGDLIRIEPAEPPELLHKKCIVGACFLYRRTVYEQIGDYNEALYRIEDYEYWLRVAQRFELKALPEILYDYRRHPGSLTNEETFVQRAIAYDKVQTIVFGPDPKRFRQYLGELYISKAFEEYLARHYGNVFTLILRSFAYNNSYLRNRGVWSIMFRSVLLNRGR